MSDYVPIPNALFDAFDLPPEVPARVNKYHQMLVEWQEKVNLVSASTLAEAAVRHFADSMQLFPYIHEKDKMVMDVGTGAGFPGMLLAMMGCSNVHLVESNTRKVVFLREVARETSTRVQIHGDRAERLKLISDIAVMTARAVASLKELFDLTAPITNYNTLHLYPKGERYEAEIEEAQQHWNFNVTVKPSVTHAGGVILLCSGVERR